MKGKLGAWLPALMGEKMNNAANIKQNANNIMYIDSRQRWCNYAWTIRNYFVSSLEDLPDSVTSKAWVIKSIYKIAEPLKDNINEYTAFKMIQLLYSMFSLLNDKVEQVKEGKEAIQLEIVDIATLSSIAELLSSLNPSMDQEKWLSALELIFNLMINQIMARTAQEWVLDEKYQEAILEQISFISDNIMIAVFSEDQECKGE